MIPIIRQIEGADLNFVLNSFLRSLRGHPNLRHIPNEVYYPEQKLTLDRYIRSCHTLVMCNPEVPDQIFGYVIGTPNIETVFVYVKYPYRKFGFAKRLLETLHPALYTTTIKAAYTCRGWAEASAQFRHIYHPYTGS